MDMQKKKEEIVKNIRILAYDLQTSEEFTINDFQRNVNFQLEQLLAEKDKEWESKLAETTKPKGVEESNRANYYIFVNDQQIPWMKDTVSYEDLCNLCGYQKAKVFYRHSDPEKELMIGESIQTKSWTSFRVEKLLNSPITNN